MMVCEDGVQDVDESGWEMMKVGMCTALFYRLAASLWWLKGQENGVRWDQ